MGSKPGYLLIFFFLLYGIFTCRCGIWNSNPKWFLMPRSFTSKLGEWSERLESRCTMSGNIYWMEVLNREKIWLLFLYSKCNRITIQFTGKIGRKSHAIHAYCIISYFHKRSKSLAKTNFRKNKKKSCVGVFDKLEIY